jgi:hypothetical protein
MRGPYARIRQRARFGELNGARLRSSGQPSDQAMAWLANAVAPGFTNVEWMKDDDLKALRGRDDFKKLVDELEAKEKARKKQEEWPRENRGQRTEDSKKQTASEKK